MVYHTQLSQAIGKVFLSVIKTQNLKIVFQVDVSLLSDGSLCCLSGSLYRKQVDLVNCLPADVAGKKTLDKKWFCNSERSCTCTEVMRDCWYCDPEGMERTGTSSYDSHGRLVSDDGGCDCRHYCEHGVEGYGIQPSTFQQTQCVRNPF